MEEDGWMVGVFDAVLVGFFSSQRLLEAVDVSSTSCCCCDVSVDYIAG